MGLYPAWPDGRSRLLWGWTAAAGRPLLAGEGRLDGGGGGGEGGIALVGPLCQVLCLCQVASHLRAHPLLGSSLFGESPRPEVHSHLSDGRADPPALPSDPDTW